MIKTTLVSKDTPSTVPFTTTISSTFAHVVNSRTDVIFFPITMAHASDELERLLSIVAIDPNWEHNLNHMRQ